MTTMAQYSIRNVPDEIDRELKLKAKQLGKSVNQLALEALARFVGVTPRVRDLSNNPYRLTKGEHDALERHLADQRQIDEELWK
jgi:plasmid stability protein